VARFGHTKAAVLLLAAGADPTLTNGEGDAGVAC